jgi:hypothetical protein
MHLRAFLCSILLACLSACGAGRNPVDAITGGAGSDLEQAAIDNGVVVDAQTSDPVGLYNREHTSGSDGFCLVQSDSGYDFAAVVSFGQDLFCQGAGSARRSGAALSLRFDGAPECNFDATFEGDAIKLAGQVPDACAKLCTPRGTFAGAEMRRVGWDANAAARLKSRTKPITLLCKK